MALVWQLFKTCWQQRQPGNLCKLAGKRYAYLSSLLMFSKQLPGFCLQLVCPLQP